MKLVHLFSLALLAALPARADRIQCNFGDQLKYPFDANQAQTAHCRPADLGPPKCAATIKSIIDAELDLNGRLAETCRRVEQVDHDVAETIGMDQLAAMNRQLVIYQGLAQDYRDFLSALNRQYREIAKTLLQDPGPLGRELKAEELSAAAATDRHALERQQFRSAIKDNTFRAMKALNPPAPRNPAETEIGRAHV